MKTEIANLNPSDYGLEEAQVGTIEQAFTPAIIERDSLAKVYETILTQEISSDTIQDARRTRLELVKVRTGIDRIHKTQKAFYLAAGRYVDAWKNKMIEPIAIMEERLSDIENFYVNQEKARKEALKKERLAELEKYESDGSLINLGEMSDNVWENYIAGVRLQYEKRKEEERRAEEERIRQQKIELLAQKRTTEIRHLWNHIPSRVAGLNIGEIEESEWAKIVSEAVEAKAAEEKEQERIRLENERLAAEIIALERKAEAQRKKAEAEKKAAEEKEQAERRAAEEERMRIEKEKQEAIDKANKERLAAEAELRRQKEEAERREQERINAEKKAEAERKAPDKDKLIALADALLAFQMPDCSSDEAATIIINTRELLGKTARYIKEKASTM